DHELTAADPPEAVERADRVAEVEEEAAEEDEVEPAVDVGVEVVDADVDSLDPRAEGLAGEREGLTAALELVEDLPTARVVLADPGLGRPVPPGWVLDVDRGDRSSAAALHLKGPEAVPRADVEAAHPGERLREGHAGDGRPGVEEAGRDEA